MQTEYRRIPKIAIPPKIPASRKYLIFCLSIETRKVTVTPTPPPPPRPRKYGPIQKCLISLVKRLWRLF